MGEANFDYKPCMLVYVPAAYMASNMAILFSSEFPR